ncbi:ferredoxin [Actinomadura darangshiensis]|uniref:Ferredoxin n=1 Tax=Actinomadura darangshiensis TaxID=705336 RepID=A0A4R5A2C0_9ACTN|nr:ferredoxin [Actinomadura darangshiensis]TDD64804.1 ferredoxin [Actinomadura darangshiensis]
MRVIVDYDQCDANGLCSELAPKIFELGADDVLRVREERPRPELWPAAEEAARACPKLAITLTEHA